MSFEEKMREKLDQKLEAQEAVKNYASSLKEAASNNIHKAHELSDKAMNSENPEESESLKQEAEKLEKQSAAYTEEACAVEKSPEKYESEYMKYSEEEKQEAKKAEQTPNENAPVHEEKPSEQIKEAFPSDGLLDRAFAEMLGNVVDTVAGHNRKNANESQNQEQEKQQAKKP